MEAVSARLAYLESHPEVAEALRRSRARQVLTETIKTLAAERSIGGLEGKPEFQKILADIAARREDPYTAAERLLGSHGG